MQIFMSVFSLPFDWRRCADSRKCWAMAASPTVGWWWSWTGGTDTTLGRGECSMSHQEEWLKWHDSIIGGLCNRHDRFRHFDDARIKRHYPFLVVRWVRSVGIASAAPGGLQNLLDRPGRKCSIPSDVMLHNVCPDSWTSKTPATPGLLSTGEKIGRITTESFHAKMAALCHLPPSSLYGYFIRHWF